METEGDVVVAVHQVEVVGQGVVGSGEERLRIATNSEVPRRRDLIDLLERRLPDVDAQIVHVDAARKSAAASRSPVDS